MKEENRSVAKPSDLSDEDAAGLLQISKRHTACCTEGGGDLDLSDSPFKQDVKAYCARHGANFAAALIYLLNLRKRLPERLLVLICFAETASLDIRAVTLICSKWFDPYEAMIPPAGRSPEGLETCCVRFAATEVWVGTSACPGGTARKLTGMICGTLGGVLEADPAGTRRAEIGVRRQASMNVDTTWTMDKNVPT